MAAGDAFVYTNHKVRAMKPGYNLETDSTIKVMLVKSYTYDATDAVRTDVVTGGVTETSASGYTARGKALTSKTVAADGANGKWDSADVTWTALGTDTYSHAIVYFDAGSGSESTCFLIMAFELGATVPSNGGDYTLQIGANGLIRIT